MKSLFWKPTLIIFITLLAVFLYPNNFINAEETLSESDRKQLEERVARLLKGDNVTLRHKIKDVFLLADLYANEGKDDEAMRLYEEALRADSWNLRYQLVFARLLNRHGDRDQAFEKAKIVYDYAEDGGLTIEAEEFIAALGEKYPVIKDDGQGKIIEDVEIVMVPIGDINTRLVSDVKNGLQEAIGVKYVISEDKIDPGKLDRCDADGYLSFLIEKIKSDLSKDKFDRLLSENNLKEADLDAFACKFTVVESFFNKIKAPPEYMDKFHQNVKEQLVKGQYDASRFLSILKDKYHVKGQSKIKGYLGVTDKDIYSENNNFLFGSAGNGYGVISYHRYTAAFNDDPPNRRRLCERTVKQAICSSFFIFGITRCTTPTCVRAYPHNLSEHDQKGTELCLWCKKQLNAYFTKRIKKNY